MDYGTITSDLQFLLTKFKKPLVGCMIRISEFAFMKHGGIASAGLQKVSFAAESSFRFSLKSLKVLEQNGFIAVLLELSRG